MQKFGRRLYLFEFGEQFLKQIFQTLLNIRGAGGKLAIKPGKCLSRVLRLVGNGFKILGEEFDAVA